MQLIAQFQTGGFDAWISGHDAHVETRDTAWNRQESALKGSISAQVLNTAILQRNHSGTPQMRRLTLRSPRRTLPARAARGRAASCPVN